MGKVLALLIVLFSCSNSTVKDKTEKIKTNERLIDCETKYVMGWAFSSFVSNISCLVELADILHFRNCNKHNSRLDVVLKRSCNYHIRKNIGKRLSALFLPFYVRNLGK